MLLTFCVHTQACPTGLTGTTGKLPTKKGKRCPLGTEARNEVQTLKHRINANLLNCGWENSRLAFHNYHIHQSLSIYYPTIGQITKLCGGDYPTANAGAILCCFTAGSEWQQR